MENEKEGKRRGKETYLRQRSDMFLKKKTVGQTQTKH